MCGPGARVRLQRSLEGLCLECRVCCSCDQSGSRLSAFHHVVHQPLPRPRHLQVQSLLCYPAKANPCSVAGWQALVDDWEFQEEPFLEFVGPSLQTLAEQLQSCEDYDAQLKVCSTWPACDGSHVWQPAHTSRMLCRTGAEYCLCISRQGAGKSVHVHTSGAVRLFAMHPSCKLYHSSNASMATIGAHQAASRHHACPLTASFETVP